MALPSLSVIVPVRNAERTLAEALESVLAQTPRDAEVLVVDGGSTDRSVAVAEEFAYLVRVVREPRHGVAAAFNRGVAESRGALIASIDPHDRWAPHKLERQLAALDADPTIDAVFGFVRQFLSPELESQRWRFVVADDPTPGIHRGVMLIRREAWMRVGPLETHLTAGAFVSWYARATAAGLTMHMIPDVVYERRVDSERTARLAG